MKKWIGRLLGGDKETASAGPAAAVLDEGELAAEVDAVYYRWLTSSSGSNVGRELEAQVLTQVRELAGDPEGAAGLVPRLPDLVGQLLGALSDENISTGAVSAEVGRDLVLVAEVIREANSAYYRPAKPIETLDGAVTMLGLNGLRMLLAKIAMRPLIRTKVGGVARQVAPNVWKHSERCAFAASVMAPGLSAGVFEAYLAGLMQNLGLVVAFRLAERAVESGKIPGSSDFGRRLFEVSRGLSAAIAAHWEFPRDVVDGIAGVGQADASSLARAVERGDQIAKLRVLLDVHVLRDDDALVTEGLDSFERRCLGKLTDVPA